MANLFKDNKLTFKATRDLHPKLAMALAGMTKEQIQVKLADCQALPQKKTPNGKKVVEYPKPIGKVLYEYEERIAQDAATWRAILKASGKPTKAVKIPEVVTFYAKCNDMGEESGTNDLTLEVTCNETIQKKFASDWDKCVSLAKLAEDTSDEEYTLTAIYDLMEARGYTITGLSTSATVGY